MSAPELSVKGKGACRTGLSHVGPGIIRRGQRACRTGLFLRVLRRPRNYPSGAKERVERGCLRRPRNYPSGAKERVGRGWLRLWGAAGAPSVNHSPKGHAPLFPELTVGADGDTVDWNTPRSVTYSRHGEIKVLPAATRSP